MTRARRLAAAGALAAFVVGGVSMVAGIGTASATTRDEPNAGATCLLPILPCEVQPSLAVPDLPIPNPLDSWSSAPATDDSWSPPPDEPAPSKEPDRPWKPADEEEHRMPQGHPETGGGGLVPEPPVWPFAAGGVALLAGAGLTGFAVRRGKGDTDAEEIAHAPQR
ncbi:hypothetical protein ACIBO2_45945 [Nonomuraea sp. NPDC050022]|uniref:hypothetical protein n=1 Tax=Nonomuraea sp. NPDC050022 TaxID=3364358 RepID=UPI0037B1AE2F